MVVLAGGSHALRLSHAPLTHTSGLGSRYLRLIHLPGGHCADQLVAALESALVSMSAGKRLTLTWDQGSEMARHDEVARLLSQDVFFADPGSPWMRGTNENTGLLRQYLPKGADLPVHDVAGLAAIETRLNPRPRKLLELGKRTRMSSGWQHD